VPHYSYEKTFAAGTSRDSQEALEMPCHWGILCDVHIAFRWGTSRLCHVHLDDGLHQIFPTNPEGTYAFDGYTLPLEGEYELQPGTRKIYLRGWNEGNHPHTVAVAFRVRIPERLTATEQLLLRLVEVLERMLGIRRSSTR
jgi:hypothetical protein